MTPEQWILLCCEKQKMAAEGYAGWRDSGRIEFRANVEG